MHIAYKHVRTCAHPNKSNRVYFFPLFYFVLFSTLLISYEKVSFFFVLHTAFCCVFVFISFCSVSFHLPDEIECSRTNLKLNSFWIDLVLFFLSFFFFLLLSRLKFVAVIFSGRFCFYFSVSFICVN